MSEIMLISI